MEPVDIVLLSNGPGELATWVRPVAKQLRQQLGTDATQVRLSVVLSPCPHATGKETAIARSYPEIDRVQSPDHFWSFLLWGKTAANWDWHRQGVVVFLGGDQFFTIAIARHLGYRSVVYAEWEARWTGNIDRFGIRDTQVFAKVSPKHRHKCTVIGDLMADVALEIPESISQNQPLIGLLPGSKPAKLTLGVPLCLAIAESIHQQQPETQFLIPVAPTLDLSTFVRYSDPTHNPTVKTIGNTHPQLILPEDNHQSPYLKTAGGATIQLWQPSPAYDVLAACSFCITTVGANTAELGTLGIPMLVLLPTQKLDAMKAWDGLPGLLANLPGVGSLFAVAINWLILRRRQRFAWPNIWAGEEIVPEWVGKINPGEVAQQAIFWLDDPESLQSIRQRLHRFRGEPGASEKLAKIVREILRF